MSEGPVALSSSSQNAGGPQQHSGEVEEFTGNIGAHRNLQSSVSILMCTDTVLPGDTTPAALVEVKVPDMMSDDLQMGSAETGKMDMDPSSETQVVQSQPCAGEALHTEKVPAPITPSSDPNHAVSGINCGDSSPIPAASGSYAPSSTTITVGADKKSSPDAPVDQPSCEPPAGQHVSNPSSSKFHGCTMMASGWSTLEKAVEQRKWIFGALVEIIDILQHGARASVRIDGIHTSSGGLQQMSIESNNQALTFATLRTLFTPQAPMLDTRCSCVSERRACDERGGTLAAALMRLSNDALVLSKSEEGTCVGFISSALVQQTGTSDDLCVPLLRLDADGKLVEGGEGGKWLEGHEIETWSSEDSVWRSGQVLVGTDEYKKPHSLRYEDGVEAKIVLSERKWRPKANRFVAPFEACRRIIEEHLPSKSWELVDNMVKEIDGTGTRILLMSMRFPDEVEVKVGDTGEKDLILTVDGQVPWKEHSVLPLYSSLTALLEFQYKGRRGDLHLFGKRVKSKSIMTLMEQPQAFDFDVKLESTDINQTGKPNVDSIAATVTLGFISSDKVKGEGLGGFFIYSQKRLVMPYIVLKSQQKSGSRSVLGCVEVAGHMHRWQLLAAEWTAFEEALEEKLQQFLELVEEEEKFAAEAAATSMVGKRRRVAPVDIYGEFIEGTEERQKKSSKAGTVDSPKQVRKRRTNAELVDVKKDKLFIQELQENLSKGTKVWVMDTHEVKPLELGAKRLQALMSEQVTLKGKAQLGLLLSDLHRGWWDVRIDSSGDIVRCKLGNLQVYRPGMKAPSEPQQLSAAAAQAAANAVQQEQDIKNFLSDLSLGLVEQQIDAIMGLLSGKTPMPVLPKVETEMEEDSPAVREDLAATQYHVSALDETDALDGPNTQKRCTSSASGREAENAVQDLTQVPDTKSKSGLSDAMDCDEDGRDQASGRKQSDGGVGMATDNGYAATCKRDGDEASRSNVIVCEGSVVEDKDSRHGSAALSGEESGGKCGVEGHTVVVEDEDAVREASKAVKVEDQDTAGQDYVDGGSMKSSAMEERVETEQFLLEAYQSERKAKEKLKEANWLQTEILSGWGAELTRLHDSQARIDSLNGMLCESRSVIRHNTLRQRAAAAAAAQSAAAAQNAAMARAIASMRQSPISVKPNGHGAPYQGVTPNINGGMPKPHIRTPQAPMSLVQGLALQDYPFQHNFSSNVARQSAGIATNADTTQQGFAVGMPLAHTKAFNNNSMSGYIQGGAGVQPMPNIASNMLMNGQDQHGVIQNVQYMSNLLGGTSNVYGGLPNIRESGAPLQKKSSHVQAANAAAQLHTIASSNAFEDLLSGPNTNGNGQIGVLHSNDVDVSTRLAGTMMIGNGVAHSGNLNQMVINGSGAAGSIFPPHLPVGAVGADGAQLSPFAVAGGAGAFPANTSSTTAAGSADLTTLAAAFSVAAFAAASRAMV